MRKKIELEYIFSSSVKVLFSRLGTPSGLSEWFADDVIQKGDRFTFVWEGVEHEATLIDQKVNSFIRWRWEDSHDENEYFEFRIRIEDLTQDVALIITDFTDVAEESDTTSLWDSQIETLHRTLGA